MTKITIGNIQNLIVKRFTGVGVYLNTAENSAQLDQTLDSDVLLPAGDVPDDCQIGDELCVFIYRDSEDRLISTTQKPKVKKGEIAKLNVVSASPVGAFLDWGLKKDLLMPFAEQKHKLKKGDSVVVYVYLDNTDRLAASSKIEKFLSEEHDFTINDNVSGTVYSINPQIGAFVAVNNKYKALIPKKELVIDLKEGERVEARITHIHPDGKINLSLRQTSSIQIHLDVDVLKNALVDAGGYMPYNDKSDAEDIKKVFGMSKKAFKRAVGVLLKREDIEFKDNGIKLNQ